MTITKTYFTDGQILLIDKPLGWSSFQAVNALKWAIRKKFDLNKKFKIGHAGTLDPLATGLLIVCTGKFTKKISELQQQPKEYTGTITLGATTPSYDLETAVNQTFSTQHLTTEKIHIATQGFLGTIQQHPPIFSAIKKDGKRLYEFARKAETVETKSRAVKIFEFDVTNLNLPYVDFRVVCSKGTYIRSIAHDFGKTLQTGGHLSALKRTKIGSYDVNNAQTPNEFKDWLENETTNRHSEN